MIEKYILKLDDVHSSRMAMAALIQMGDEAVPALIAAIPDANQHLFSAIRQVLGQIGAIAPLVQAMAGADPQLRLRLIDCLASIPNPAIVEPLAQQLLAEEDEVALHTAVHLCESRLEGTQEALRSALQHKNEWVSVRVLTVLVQCDDQRVVPMIVDSLKDERALVRAMAVRAVRGLVESEVLGASEAIDILRLMKRDKDVLVQHTAHQMLAELEE